MVRLRLADRSAISHPCRNASPAATLRAAPAYGERTCGKTCQCARYTYSDALANAPSGLGSAAGSRTAGTHTSSRIATTTTQSLLVLSKKPGTAARVSAVTVAR